jgi:hypothetical protein
MMSAILDVLNGSLKESETQSFEMAKGLGSMSDRFDPARLRVSQQFGQTTMVEKRLTSVPVTKPNRQQWVRVHPDSSYRENVALIELKDSGQIYLVEPSLVGEIPSEISYVTLFTAMTRDNTLFLWPVKLAADGRPNSWYDSAREAAAEAMTSWVRVAANMAIGAYEYWVAPGNLAEPKWPALSFAELLAIAFKGDRLIESLDHPIVGRLKGMR